MNDVVVIFRKDLPPQILHGQDGSKYKGNPKALINPVFPRDKQGHVIPPHQWFQVGNDIAATYTEHQQSKRIPSKYLYFVAGCLSGILTVVVYCLVRKIL